MLEYCKAIGNRSVLNGYFIDKDRFGSLPSLAHGATFLDMSAFFFVFILSSVAADNCDKCLILVCKRKNIGAIVTRQVSFVSTLFKKHTLEHQ